MTLNLNDQHGYEKSIVNLALRQFAQKQFQDAIAALEAGDSKKSDDCSERGSKASEIADRLA